MLLVNTHIYICHSRSGYNSCYMDKKGCTYFLFNCSFNCPFKCPVITYGQNNENCENMHTIYLKFYTFKVHPVINLSNFRNPKKKTFLIENYSNFNFQNRGFSIKKNPYFFYLKFISKKRKKNQKLF